MEPFGFGRKQMEKKMENPDLIEAMQPVEVKAVMKKDKNIRPLSIIWEDEEFLIDKVYDVKEGKSLKEHQNGFVYRCRIGQKEFILVFDGARWYIDI